MQPARVVLLIAAAVLVGACVRNLESGTTTPGTTGGPSADPSPGAWESKSPYSDAFETILAGRRILAPGETVAQPILFESAPIASISLYAPSGSLTVHLGSATFVESPRGDGNSYYSSRIANPSDADLVLTNEAGVAIDVDALVMIATTRELVVTAPPTGIAGVPFTFEISLTGGNGETPTVWMADGDDVTTPISIVESEPGSWVGTAVPGHAGGFRVFARISGDRPRSAVDFVNVATETGDFLIGEPSP